MAMYLLWEGATPPAGWTFDTSHDDRLLKIGDTYEDGGGDAHAVSFGATPDDRRIRYSMGGGPHAATGHGHHSVNTSMGTFPVNRSIRLIKSNATPMNLPSGVIGFSKGVFSNWQAMDDYFEKFVLLKNQAPVNSGSNTHTHDLPQTGVCDHSHNGISGGRSVPTADHYHTINGTIDSVETEPEWCGLQIIKSITEAELPLGLIAMFDAAPDNPGWERGWRVLNSINAYLKCESFLKRGGTNSPHTHPHNLATNSTPSGSRSWGSNRTYDQMLVYNYHTHSISFGDSIYTPPCVQFIFAEYRDEEVVLLPMYGSKSYTPIRTEDVQVGDKVRLYPYNGGGKVAIKEYWQTGDQITIKKEDI